jgi:hypothetical protein
VEILRIHTRSVPLAPDFDLDRIAASTPGATGADDAWAIPRLPTPGTFRGCGRVPYCSAVR